MTRARRARVAEAVARVVTGGAAAVALLSVVLVVGYVLVRGAGSISWTFLTDIPRKSMTAGGISPAILGSFLLTSVTAFIALPVGVSAGVYLSEYAPRNTVTRVLRLAIANMAGVPSIVYGLFGLALFVIQFHMRKSVLAGSLTLACLTLPVIITATEEALRQ
ncbi:MAG: phosphate ABC transporter, permease protein PstA, partial [Actinobacteria bacterium]